MLAGQIDRRRQMLACMAASDFDAVMDRPSRDTGRRRCRAAAQAAASSSAVPPASARAIIPGSHGRPSAARPIITRSAPDCASASRASLEAVDVAIHRERDRNRVFHLAHRAPIGAALVELIAGAAMHGDELHARLLRAPRKFGRVHAIVVPAEPHLQGDRHLHRRHGRLDQRQRMVEIAHQRRARLPVGHVLGRAAHIDIDDVGAGILPRSGRPRPSSAPRSRQAGPHGSRPRVHRHAAPRRACRPRALRLPPSRIRQGRRPSIPRPAETERRLRPDIGASTTRFGNSTGPTLMGLLEVVMLILAFLPKN